MREFFGSIREYGLENLRMPFVGIGFFSSIINILGLVGPLFMLQVYDRVLPSGAVPTLVALLILTFSLYVFSGVVELIRSRMFVRLAEVVDESISIRVLNVIAGTPLRIRMQGDSLKPAQEADRIRAYLASSSLASLLDLPWVPIYLGVCFLLHPWIGVAACGAIVLQVIIAAQASYRIRELTNESAKALAVRNSIGEAAYGNAETVAAMGMSARLADRWSDAARTNLALQARAADTLALLTSISKTLRAIMQSGTLGLGAYLAIHNDMSAGAIIAASVIVARTLAPVETVIASWREMQAAWHAWQRLTEIFAFFPLETERTELPAPSRFVSLEGVWIAPPATQRFVVQNVDFRVEAGTAVGIIGPSGSGKSSLVRGVAGVWPAHRGRITLDGASLDQWSAASRGTHIGYMPQSCDLLPGTIAENIARLDPDASDAAIVAAAREAEVHDLITALPKGYETPVGTFGENLSAGQRQRIALARALYRDPFLVVLDEPNSNLDIDGDRALALAVGRIKARGGIVLIVAHRNAILPQLDQLAVIEAGQLKAMGARDAVLQTLNQSSRRTGTGSNLSVVEGAGR